MRNLRVIPKLLSHMDLSKKEVVCNETNGIKKFCSDCKATRTPLWRAGPAGPKSLCNACGIRYRKSKRTMMGLKKENQKKLRESGGNCSNLGEDLRARLVGLRKEVVVLQRQRSPKKRQIRTNMKKIGEVEKAAYLLLALKCGCVFA